MLGFATRIPEDIPYEIAPSRCHFLDVNKVRDLVTPFMNQNTHEGVPRFRDVRDYCYSVQVGYGIKMWKILHTPHLYWGDASIRTLSDYLGVMPKDIILERKLAPVILHSAKKNRPQDFIHDVLQLKIMDSMKGKRLSNSEYNEWLSRIIECSPRTIYNLRNGTANPSNILVGNLARHFGMSEDSFYRGV